MLKLDVFIDDDTDMFINVFDMGDGQLLIRDSKENIQFVCKPGFLDYNIVNDDTFFDEIFYGKVNAQTEGALESKDDLFYIDCLFSELDRIFAHCRCSYKQFENIV